jgi:hypothetical protein
MLHGWWKQTTRNNIRLTVHSQRTLEDWVVRLQVHCRRGDAMVPMPMRPHAAIARRALRSEGKAARGLRLGVKELRDVSPGGVT